MGLRYLVRGPDGASKRSKTTGIPSKTKSDKAIIAAGRWSYEDADRRTAVRVLPDQTGVSREHVFPRFFSQEPRPTMLTVGTRVECNSGTGDGGVRPAQNKLAADKLRARKAYDEAVAKSSREAVAGLETFKKNVMSNGTDIEQRRCQPYAKRYTNCFPAIGIAIKTL